MSVNIDKLQIEVYPHPSLRQKAEAVAAVNDEVRAVARRMLELMHEARGVGLAAPQVGLGWRMFVANPTGEPADDRVYINPVLSEPSTHTDALEEGCLSIPDVKGVITRPVGITVDALDEHGRKIHERSEELAARIWQHETDHLNGVLILDRMTELDKRSNKTAIEALEGK
jgi:peptide deformylase